MIAHILPCVLESQLLAMALGFVAQHGRDLWAAIRSVVWS